MRYHGRIDRAHNLSRSLPNAEWLEVDEKRLTATLVAPPDATALMFNVDLQRVIEFYSSSL